MLQYIHTAQIQPHPDNPRKDLGDLTELAESIKANGIMQNLTVTPYAGYYRIVIGHRRYAAAKLAGLTEVPCIVSHMELRDQIATMLLENMQRNDLTIYEQAQGFQMMLDFGDSVLDIAGRTGFSETTVRRRVKLLELDEKKFKESVERGATLLDFIELNKIENIKVRNKVLVSIGTQNWKWELRQALEEQELPRRKQAFMEFIKDWAKPVKTVPNNSTYEHNFYGYKLDNFKKPKDAGKGEYCYIDSGNGASLYKKTAAAEKKKVSETEKAYKDRDAQVKDLAKRAYQLRADFVKNFGGGKKYAKTIMDFTMIRLMRYGGIDTDNLLKILEIEVPENIEGKDYMEMVNIKRDMAFKKYLEQPERVMLLTAWAALDSNENYYDSYAYNCTIKHKPNSTLDGIYNGLIALGYEMSDDEKALQNGTHKLFKEKF